jgi:hypothetical protein
LSTNSCRKIGQALARPTPKLKQGTRRNTELSNKTPLLQFDPVDLSTWFNESSEGRKKEKAHPEFFLRSKLAGE